MAGNDDSWESEAAWAAWAAAEFADGNESAIPWWALDGHETADDADLPCWGQKGGPQDADDSNPQAADDNMEIGASAGRSRSRKRPAPPMEPPPEALRRRLAAGTMAEAEDFPWREGNGEPAADTGAETPEVDSDDAAKECEIVVAASRDTGDEMLHQYKLELAQRYAEPKRQPAARKATASAAAAAVGTAAVASKEARPRELKQGNPVEDLRKLKQANASAEARAAAEARTAAAAFAKAAHLRAKAEQLRAQAEAKAAAVAEAKAAAVAEAKQQGVEKVASPVSPGPAETDQDPDLKTMADSMVEGINDTELRTGLLDAMNHVPKRQRLEEPLFQAPTSKAAPSPKPSCSSDFAQPQGKPQEKPQEKPAEGNILPPPPPPPPPLPAPPPAAGTWEGGRWAAGSEQQAASSRQQAVGSEQHAGPTPPWRSSSSSAVAGTAVARPTSPEREPQARKFRRGAIVQAPLANIPETRDERFNEALRLLGRVTWLLLSVRQHDSGQHDVK